MTETRTEVKVELVRMMCECGGELRSDGFARMSHPPEYRHICTKCTGRGHDYEWLPEKYPRPEYTEVKP